jgi:cellobiose phosphorylase
MAADVYALSPHIGRGGWTWYTGSAGWMYRLIVESILGLRLEIEKMFISPRIPSHWESYKIYYRFRETRYLFVITQIDNGDKKMVITVDGNKIEDEFITLTNDGQEHTVEVIIAKEG